MTQNVLNTLNNFQEMLGQGKKSASFLVDPKEISSMDKMASSKDFSKIFDKQVETGFKSSKQEENTKVVSKDVVSKERVIVSVDNLKCKNVSADTSVASKTNTEANADLGKSVKVENVESIEAESESLDNISANILNWGTSEKWASFKEILAKATGEANVETSLDLTLARDINEIITQLKDAIDETIDTTEDVVEKTDVVEETTEQELDEEFPFPVIPNADIATEDKLPLNVEKISELDLQTNKVITFEQVMMFVNKFADKKGSVDIELAQEKNTEVLDSVEVVASDVEAAEVVNNLLANEQSRDEAVKTLQDIEDQLLEDDILKDLNVESIKADVDTSSEGFLMDSQTPEEQGVKAMLTQEFEAFDLPVEKGNVSVQNVQQVAQTVQAKTVDVNPSKILDQVAKQLEGLQNSSKVNIVLNPESLGRVTVQLVKTGEGLSAQFTVASQEVRDMLMKGLDGLKESLISQGVGIEQVSVKIADSQKSEYSSDWTEQEGSRGGNKEQRQQNQEKEKGSFEKMMAQAFVEEENGNV